MISKKADFILSGSVCTRCGKQRIAIDSYQEKVGTSTLLYTITSCPDPECQKVVENELRETEKKREVMRDEQAKRETLRKATALQKHQPSVI